MNRTRHRSHLRPLAALAVAASLLAACSSDSSVRPIDRSTDTGGTTAGSPITTEATGDTASDGERPDSDAAFGWKALDGVDDVEVGTLEVPIDHDDPSKGTFELAVARHLADPDQRIGSLLVNPGGPGFGGRDFGIYADQIYDQVLLDRFDIVGWDPRGTGLTSPAVDCTDDYDHFYAGFDITPDDEAERQQLVDLAKEFADVCMERSGDIIPYIGTNASARDMDLIRQALGEDRISYFGFSYGSELGATWATLFPETVRAAVLDGAIDPDADFVESGLQQSAGFEQAIATFLAQCSADDTCEFHNGGNAEATFDALMLALDEQPIPSAEGRPDLTRGMALQATAEAMYSESLWPALAAGLAAAEQGDGGGLLALFDQYYQRQADGSYDNSLEAFQVIECQDSAERLTVEEDDATAADFNRVAPRAAPSTVGSYFCTFFPPSTDPSARITGKGAGPILVMGTTGDPATPLASTEKMARALEDGRLVIVEAEGHTGYGANACSSATIDDYLIDPVGKAPADGTRCA